MKDVLVDTSVWVDSFKQSNDILSALLLADMVVVHPMVRGEIALGTPPERRRVLRDLALLRPAPQPTVEEVIMLVEQNALYGRGCGLVDICLLASCLKEPGLMIWTLDRRLATLGERFGVLFRPTH